MIDFLITNQGSLVGFVARSAAARQWLDDNTNAEGWQYLGSTLWVDHRMADNLLDGIVEAGFAVSS